MLSWHLAHIPPLITFELPQFATAAPHGIEVALYPRWCLASKREHKGASKFCLSSSKSVNVTMNWQRRLLGAVIHSSYARNRTYASAGKAFAKGPREPQLLEQTIPEHFASIVSMYGDRPAVISRHQHARRTYEELDCESSSLAQGLERSGVTKGARVAVSLGNNIQYAIATYALFKLGAILVPLNPAFTPTQVISALNHLSASHLIIGAETNLPWKEPQSNMPMLENIAPNIRGSKMESDKVPSLSRIILVNNAAEQSSYSALKAVTFWENVLDDGDGRLEPKNLSSAEVVNIQFTSGTTSMPKAACLSHRSILNNGKSIGDRMLLTEKDVVCCPPPLFHCFGSILGYMATATHGSCIVFPAEAFNPEASLRAVQENECTALYGVPTMFLQELALLENGIVQRHGFQHLRTGIAAGTNIPEELMRKLHRELNLTQLTICYGMTETSPVSLMTRTDDPMQKRISTVGALMPHVSAKIVDPLDRTRVLSIGEPGELCTSGYLVMKEYWDDQAKTEEVMVKDENGVTWMHTGDEAIMDQDSYVRITGRLKDLIIRGGENIHPLDIENSLLSYDAVSDASAVGVPDPKYGEAVGVFILLKPGASLDPTEARQWIRERVGNHMVPKYIFNIDTFPKTPSGKIQKFKLREIAAKRVKQGDWI